MSKKFQIALKSISDASLIHMPMMYLFNAMVSCSVLFNYLTISNIIYLILDIDQCAIGNGNCSHICVNDIPYYHCDCPPGGQLDPTKINCIFNANCRMTDNNFTCTCRSGYEDLGLKDLNCTGKTQDKYTKRNETLLGVYHQTILF